jgi:hypothetical protein
MVNVVFGSGVVGLIAKTLLGVDWKVIPFYRSRFFSFNPALDDNFIIRDEKIDGCVRDLLQAAGVPMFIYRRAWSVRGELVTNWDRGLCRDWLMKICGSQIPPQSEIYLADRMNLFVYDIRVNQLYQRLMQVYTEELTREAAKGAVTEIGDHYFIRNGIREDFDNAVNTIPIHALYKLLGVTGQQLPSKTLHYLHVQTTSLDFEGANQVLVVDPLFSFFKVTNLAPDRYLFYFHEEVHNPGVYFMPFMKSFDILDGTSIEHALPLGSSPKLDWLEEKGVFCVGSYAQWDWCMDMGSCILRLVRYAQRGFKPFKRKVVV